jgi:hypothetical protein
MPSSTSCCARWRSVRRSLTLTSTPICRVPLSARPRPPVTCAWCRGMPHDQHPQTSSAAWCSPGLLRTFRSTRSCYTSWTRQSADRSSRQLPRLATSFCMESWAFVQSTVRVPNCRLSSGCYPTPAIIRWPAACKLLSGRAAQQFISSLSASIMIEPALSFCAPLRRAAQVGVTGSRPTLPSQPRYTPRLTHR